MFYFTMSHQCVTSTHKINTNYPNHVQFQHHVHIFSDAVTDNIEQKYVTVTVQYRMTLENSENTALQSSNGFCFRLCLRLCLFFLLQAINVCLQNIGVCLQQNSLTL